MLKEGLFIQERYEIISKIGSGGMADVYKAKDHKLNRLVAVKVLKSELREDKVFVAKFRTEAQSAAGLAHPNIVNVYDVGDDNGVYFIVMELVEGITLKEYIEKKGRLAVREATSIAIQVSMGLEAAHHKNIVHRDVKPQNIIISTDGKVKIADFGIARAASSNTISANVMGSVHYSSPEQARGGYSDYRTDIYSLGITMYEMITGQVPFDGETTVAIAIKHLQEEMQSPRKYVPDLPKSTVQIIYKCTQKSPDRRYDDMEALVRDLKESLVNPDGDFVALTPLVDHAQTVVMGSEQVEQIQQARATQEPPVTPPQEDYRNQQYREQQYREQQYRDRQVNSRDEDDEDDDSGVSSKTEKFLTIGSIVIGVIILCVFLALVGSALNLFDFSGRGNSQETQTETESNTVSDQVTVPNIKGMTEDDARAELAKYNLGMDYDGEEASSEYQAGQIVSQSPEADEKVDKNTTVTYKISAGPEDVYVPNVVGKTLSEAQSEFSELGLKLSTSYESSSDIAEGNIIRTTPAAGSTASPGDTVQVVISQGYSTQESTNLVEVPQVEGNRRTTAVSELENAGFYVDVTEQASDEYSEGVVISQSIASGTMVAYGTSITLVVSTGVEAGTDSTDSGIPGGTPSSETDSIASTSYSCDVDLLEPSSYAGEPVRIVLTQDGEENVIVDGEAVAFPYHLSYSSESSTTASAYIYILDEATGAVKTTVSYDGIPFSAE